VGLELRSLICLRMGSLPVNTFIQEFSAIHLKLNYSGRIHEQISDPILALGYQIAPSGVIIYHYGYKSHDSARISRNRDLISSGIE
jgi:hypothetical protein